MARLIIHADDVGMCHGANRAYVELSHFGTITSGSVMVPCPWFSEIADIVAHDDSLDCGIHLTLNSEHQHYRWGPVSSVGPSSGLLDEHGFLWRDVASVRRRAHPEAVEQEWRAQIDRALAAGIKVSHLDAHMGSALAPEWCDRYVALGIEYEVPVLITTSLAAYGPNRHLLDPGTAAESVDEVIRSAAATARAAGMPVFDLVLETDFSRPPHRQADYKAMLGGLSGALPSNEHTMTSGTQPSSILGGLSGALPSNGLVFCAFHPNAPGGREIEAIEPATCHVRIDEYEIFSTGGWKDWLTSQPLELASMASCN